MALALLVNAWANRRGGRATALIVDHGIRIDSASETRAVKAELSRKNVPSEILRYAGPKFSTDLQAAARKRRYELLSEWCVSSGCLHLAVAHHVDDQAETLLLRLARGSGVDGLASMAPIVATRELRILRPLLEVTSQRLHATLVRYSIGHVDDPSNRNPAFARVRMRALSPVFDAEGMTSHRLADTASRMARAGLHSKVSLRRD